MTWLVSRWVKPKRDRDKRIVEPGRWFDVGAMSEREAEKAVRAHAVAGNVARATSGGSEMKAYPATAWRKGVAFAKRAPA